MLSTRLMMTSSTLLDAGKAHPSIERQVFLSRVGDLQHVALEASGGKSSNHGIDQFERR